MSREIHRWFSPNLNKDMDLVVYGNYGFALLMFPTAGADFLEYERFKLIDSIGWFLGEGKLKAFSINSINNESWLNNNMHPADKAIRHQQYNKYVVEEVVPFIHNHCKGLVPIIITGASLGALHAINNFPLSHFFKHIFIIPAGQIVNGGVKVNILIKVTFAVIF